MAKTLTSLFIMLLLLSISACELGLADAQKTWCVAKTSSSQEALTANINYVCTQTQVDCTSVGSVCPLPNNLLNIASFAMNLYYATNGRNTWNCYFNNTGLVVITDPSYEGCTYP